MPVTDETYERVALEDPEGIWELHEGRLRSKPGSSAEHNCVMCELGFRIGDQLDRKVFSVRINSGRLRHIARRYETNCYVPDVFVFPTGLSKPLRGLPKRLEVYDAPVALVAEVWSPRLEGREEYDGDAKLPVYRLRGDLEIWRLHPLDRILTAWRRQPDGTYDEGLYDGGTIQPVALPNVTIDLYALFE
jgi:Uma2 family endonuclease